MVKIFLLIFLFSAFNLAAQIDTISSDSQKDPIELFKISKQEYDLQHYPEAIDYANKSLEIYKTQNDLQKIGAILEYIGIYYAEFSDYENSIKYLLESLDIAEKQKDDKSINSRKLNIGTTYIEARNFIKGIEIIEKAVIYYQENEAENAKFLIASYSNLGVAFNELNLLDSAMYYYKKAEKLANQEQIIDQIGGPLLNIGEIHLKNNDIDKALEYYLMAELAFESVNDNKGIWHTNFGIAHVYSKQGKFDDAINLLDKTIEHYKETNDLTYLAKSYNELSNIYEAQGEFQLSIKYKNEFISVKDSISTSEIINKINNLENQYKIEKLQSENQSKLQIIQQERKIIALRWYIATGILIIFIILIITLNNRNKNQKKLIETQLKNIQLEQNRLEVELSFRNKELENFALHIVQKNDFLQDIKAKLKELKSKASDKNSDEIKELSIKINQSLRINKELEKFRQRVDEVNSQFFNLLGEKYPELTEKEKRLCALLKLNLSSKEIASLNNISEGAVTMARYRLRKKIGLANDENLTELFQKLA